MAWVALRGFKKRMKKVPKRGTLRRGDRAVTASANGKGAAAGASTAHARGSGGSPGSPRLPGAPGSPAANPHPPTGGPASGEPAALAGTRASTCGEEIWRRT